MTLEQQLPSRPRTAATEGERLVSEARLKEQHERNRKILEELGVELPVSPVLHGHGTQGSSPGKEKAWHRSAAYLVAAGWDNKQVAEATGYSVDQVHNLQKAPWFQAAVTQIIDKNGGSDIMAMIRAQQSKALQVLVEVLDNPKAPANTRAQVANSILDRVMGKATQRVEHSGSVVSSDPVEEHAQLEQELARLRESRTGGPN